MDVDLGSLYADPRHRARPDGLDLGPDPHATNGDAAVAQWKMVDKDDLLYFPTKYSVGLALYVLVGHEVVMGT